MIDSKSQLMWAMSILQEKMGAKFFGQIHFHFQAGHITRSEITESRLPEEPNAKPKAEART